MTYNFNKDISIGKWEIKIDTKASYGYAERNSDGTQIGLWFGGPLVDGKTQLIDYDGVTELPQSIVKALRAAGYFLDDTHDPEPV